MKTPDNHWPSLLSSILFFLSGLLLLGIALLMGMAALVSLFTGVAVQAQQSIFLLAFGFEALLLFAATFFTFQRYLQKAAANQEISLTLPGWQIGLLLLGAGASILIGYLLGGLNTINWLFLPILTIPAIVLPLAALLAFGTQRLPLGTRWQTWSVLGLAMTLAPFLLFALEIVVAILIFVGVVAYLVANPALVSDMQALSQQILILGPQSEEARELLYPLITKPGVIVVALLYIAVLVPAIEEIFKPLGVWLFAGKLDSPAKGFTLGALSGAGYALIETIGVSGQQTEGWAGLLFSRIGTGLLHITTSALMGTAIVLVWRERRYLRLLGTYLLAVCLHGLWNMLAMLFTFSSFAELSNQTGPLRTLQPAMLAALVLLALGLIAILFSSNRRLRQGFLHSKSETDTPHEQLDAGEPMQ